LSCRVWVILKFSSSTEVFEFFYGGFALPVTNCCING
jgi:hypothetical protein